MRNTRKLEDLRIDKAYRASCAGIQINILDIPKIFNFGRIKIAEGANDGELASSIRAYVTHFLAKA